MASLKILYPDIPFNSVSVTPQVINTTDFIVNEWDLVTGPRYTRYRFGSSAVQRHYTFDLGTDYASKQSQANYIYVARADISILLGATDAGCFLYSSTDGSSFSDAGVSISDFTNLLGPRNEDAIGFGTLTSSFRYWRVIFSSSFTRNYEHSKVYFGQYFEFETEPAFQIEKIHVGESNWHASSGANYFARSTSGLYRFHLHWQGISNVKLESFREKILNYSISNPVVLYTTTVHDVLDSQRLVHCRIDDAEWRQVYNDWNEVRVTFEEIIG